MSDTKLRDLERRWKETGSPGDEAAYLLERVRVGDLTQERLELAAYCGHEGASTAIASTKSQAPLSGFVAGLSRFGDEVLLRAAVSAGRLCAEFADEQKEEASAAILAKLRALECPCAEHKDALTRCMLSLRLGSSLLIGVVYTACQAPSVIPPGANRFADHPAAAASEVTRLASLRFDEKVVRAAVAKDLCAWALRQPSG